jgi:hypothetical protein
VPPPSIDFWRSSLEAQAWCATKLTCLASQLAHCPSLVHVTPQPPRARRAHRRPHIRILSRVILGMPVGSIENERDFSRLLAALLMTDLRVTTGCVPDGWRPFCGSLLGPTQSSH